MELYLDTGPGAAPHTCAMAVAHVPQLELPEGGIGDCSFRTTMGTRPEADGAVVGHRHQLGPVCAATYIHTSP